MKFIKRIGMVLAVLIVLWTLLAFFGPKRIHVERSMAMQTDASVPFNQVNTLKNWKNWSYWDHLDTVTMKDTWEGPEAGAGAKHGWDSPNKQVGKGTLTITKSEPNRFVETELYFDGMGTSMGGWKMADTAGMAKVTTYMDMDVAFMMRPVMLFMNMDKMLGDDFEKSLTSLKNYCEKMPKQEQYTLVEKDQPAMMLLTVKDSVKNIAEIGPKLGEMFQKVGVEMKKAGAEFAGPVFAVYSVFKPGENIVFEAGVQVNRKVTGKMKEVRYWETQPGKVVCLDYYGPYDKMQPAYDQINQWAKDNNKKLGKDAWELYVGDPGLEKDPMKVLTQVMYYIE
jgi:effector-binding domain-containing protein